MGYWSGLTSDSGEVYQDKQLPIWETWVTSNDVFQSSSNNVTPHRHSLHDFSIPRQLIHAKGKSSFNEVSDPPEVQLMSSEKFNSDAAVFIMQPQPGPGGKNYSYNTGKGLLELNNAWPSPTPIEERGIKSFPLTAIETKSIFSIVKTTGLTPIPLWQGPAASTQPEAPASSTWTTCVLVDPHGQTNHVRPATPLEITKANKSDFLSCKNYLYGSIGMFYSFQLDANEAATFRRGRKSGVDEGDYAVLVALHVNTHEVPFWTWQTFYWEPQGTDSPNAFPGSKAGQPKNLKTPWNNYATCTTYSQTTTPGGNVMNVCFNPYLEPGLPSGIESNCMSCHGVARVSSGDISSPEEYKKPIDFFKDPQYFNTNSTNTEFSWAVADVF